MTWKPRSKQEVWPSQQPALVGNGGLEADPPHLPAPAGRREPSAVTRAHALPEGGPHINPVITGQEEGLLGTSPKATLENNPWQVSVWLSPEAVTWETQIPHPRDWVRVPAPYSIPASR